MSRPVFPGRPAVSRLGHPSEKGAHRAQRRATACAGAATDRNSAEPSAGSGQRPLLWPPTKPMPCDCWSHSNLAQRDRFHWDDRRRVRVTLEVRRRCGKRSTRQWGLEKSRERLVAPASGHGKALAPLPGQRPGRSGRGIRQAPSHPSHWGPETPHPALRGRWTRFPDPPTPAEGHPAFGRRRPRWSAGPPSTGPEEDGPGSHPGAGSPGSEPVRRGSGGQVRGPSGTRPRGGPAGGPPVCRRLLQPPASTRPWAT